MAKETITLPPRELNFYGEGKAESIKRGFAITSLRNPKADYEFSKGERILANCSDDGEKVPVVVVSNETKNLYAFSVPQLLLDGFYSVAHAARRMRPYPGYEKTDEKSVLQAITFVKEDVFNALSDSLKKTVMDPEKTFNDLVKEPDLRHLFFPTMCQHLINNDEGIVSWMEFLQYNNLAPWNEVEAIKKARFEGINFYDYHVRHPRLFEELMSRPRAIVFSALVCLQPDRKEYH